ncbi:MAG: ROK family protein [Pikeienuella sp.]
MRLGIDLGGSKIEIVALGPADDELHRARTATPQTYEGVLAAVAGLVTAAERVAGPAESLGIGVPGSIGPATGVMRGANATCLNGRPLDSDLSSSLGRPVILENDANCFALAEAVAGAGCGAGSVFGVILGTGVGGGIVIDGRLLSGATRVAGEWGHTPLPLPTDAERPGPLCYCGRRGCVETWVSGPALARDHRDATGRALTPPEIAEAARRDDPAATATLWRHRERLGRALGPVVNILDPEVIVLGGGLSGLPGLAEGLPAALAPHVFSDQPATRVVRNRLGDSAGVLGAAWLGARDPRAVASGGQPRADRFR